jgi:hypothetical protein
MWFKININSKNIFISSKLGFNKGSEFLSKKTIFLKSYISCVSNGGIWVFVFQWGIEFKLKCWCEYPLKHTEIMQVKPLWKIQNWWPKIEKVFFCADRFNIAHISNTFYIDTCGDVFELL